MEQITSSSLVVHLKLMCLLKKPTHDGIIEAKEVYIQQSFGRYKGKLVLHNLSPSVYDSSYAYLFFIFQRLPAPIRASHPDHISRWSL